MLADFEEGTFPAKSSAAVCVIGAGAAGITVAREFLSTNATVILLESGGEEIDEASHEPFRSQVTGLPHRGISQGRARVFGGTTKLWAGQALPLFPLDFEPRDWVPYSGWPIRRAALVPYYRRAEEAMQIPHVTYDRRTWPNASPPPTSNRSPILHYYSQFAAVPDFSKKYGTELRRSKNITVVTHASVVSIEANGRGIRSVRIRSAGGRHGEVEAKVFVLCCGGIESARLLLVSDSVESRGVGNRHDVVGRFFQDHAVMAVPLRPRDSYAFSNWYDPCRRGGLLHAIKVVTTPDFQRRNRLLHLGGEVHYPVDLNDPVLAAKSLLTACRGGAERRALWKNLSIVTRSPRTIIRTAARRFIFGRAAVRTGGGHHLLVQAEQEPNPASRVTLTSERDSFGMRRASLDWRLTEAVSRSFQISLNAIADEWSRLGVADLMVEQVAIAGRERGEHGGFADFFHHIGATRMGNDAKSSVVAPDCRIHGYDNIYVASSAVFPTGGFSNPTLTLLALSIRIADAVKVALLSPT